MELVLAERAAQDAQTIGGCLKRIGDAIARRQFATAEKWAGKLYDLDNGMGLFYMGFTNELQGFGGCAETYYTQGANLNQANCRESLKRIATSGYLTDKQINNVVYNFMLHEAMLFNMSAEVVNNMWQGSSNNYYENSSNRSRAAQKANCSICKGTGYDLTPYEYIANAGCHNNAGTTCHLCGQSTDHWHYKCNH